MITRRRMITMKKTLKFILSMACILAMILPDAAFVLAAEADHVVPEL